ncbi:DUF3221 domain-containing protein [Paenibacillus luteus]|uniref:DUF3221 domain-containing protein n=1 Tax=Paenibacillus luteus TaxID=2545753 RepID=UPI0019D5B984|nr:DUF3221 domain-containing protein [Paenibacillus luteus]
MVEGDYTDSSYSSSGGQKNYYSAIWFSAVPSTIDIGMKVEVWSVGGEVADSYPQQGKTERVAVISNTEIEGSQLLAAEAVKKAISSLEIGEDSFSVVKEVQFDPTASLWTVSVLNEKRDKIIPIQIPDRK